MDPVEEIKQKTNIVDLVGGYIDLKKAGRNYRGLCPFHSEKTPSFMVSTELQIFKCFGCGEGGDIFTFHQKMEGVEFPATLEYLAERAGVKIAKRDYDPNRSKKKIIYEINHLASQFYHYILVKHKVGKGALSYLKKERKLTKKTIEEFNIGYAPVSKDSLCKFLAGKKYKTEDMIEAGVIVPTRSGLGNRDKFRGRVMFPLVDVGGRFVGFTGRVLGEGNPKYLNTPGTLVFDKSSYIFGLDKAKVALKKEGAVFVEGQMDVITANQSGIMNVVASSGTSLTAGQLKIISRYTNDITFAFDSDTAGMAAVHRAIELSEKNGFNVKVAMIPEKYKDLDEYILADPKEAQKLLKESVPAYDFFLASALRRHNTTSPIGKKKIMGELVPIFCKLTDPVLRDHYIKKISQELGITETVVADLFSDPKKVSAYLVSESKKSGESVVHTDIKRSTQEYVLALLLRAPLGAAQAVLYKLRKKDFTRPDLQEIFAGLKKYLTGRKKNFEIKIFSKKFDKDTSKIVDELYLWDVGSVVDDHSQIERELGKVCEGLRKTTAKKELKELSTKIRQAELENNKDLLEELSAEFKELSGKLV